jgi:modulator of FtsH protease
MSDRFSTIRSQITRSPAISTVIDSSAQRVLRNTYLLLSLCLGFSAVTAGASVAFALPPPGIFITLVGYYGLLFLVTKFRNQGLGIAFIFALTGFLGYTLGPLISHHLHMPNGTLTVMTALGGTAAIFLGLSAYALISKRDFSAMGSFLMIGILLAFFTGLAAIFLHIPALSLTVSAIFVLLMSGLIVYKTSEIIHGGETNYIMATVTLFVALYNLFASLMELLGFANRN